MRLLATTAILLILSSYANAHKVDDCNFTLSDINRMYNDEKVQRAFKVVMSFSSYQSYRRASHAYIHRKSHPKNKRILIPKDPSWALDEIVNMISTAMEKTTRTFANDTCKYDPTLSPRLKEINKEIYSIPVFRDIRNTVLDEKNPDWRYK